MNMTIKEALLNEPNENKNEVNDYVNKLNL
jgi:hypothetical protein